MHVVKNFLRYLSLTNMVLVVVPKSSPDVLSSLLSFYHMKRNKEFADPTA